MSDPDVSDEGSKSEPVRDLSKKSSSRWIIELALIVFLIVGMLVFSEFGAFFKNPGNKKFGTIIFAAVISILFWFACLHSWRRRAYEPAESPAASTQKFIRETQVFMMATGVSLIGIFLPVVYWEKYFQFAVTGVAVGIGLMLCSMLAAMILQFFDLDTLSRARMQFRTMDLFLLVSIWGNSAGMAYFCTLGFFDAEENGEWFRGGWLAILLFMFGGWAIEGFLWGLKHEAVIHGLTQWRARWPVLVAGWVRAPSIIAAVGVVTLLPSAVSFGIMDRSLWSVPMVAAGFALVIILWRWARFLQNIGKLFRQKRQEILDSQKFAEDI